MNWSELQLDIYRATAETSDSLLIEAVAGSGKTTTIVEAIKHVPAGRSVLFCAFNKAIADTLKSRITSPNATCATLHSLGLRTWQAFTGGGVRVEGRKSWDLLKEIEPRWDRRKELGAVVKLVGLAKQYGMVPRGLQRLSGTFMASDEGITQLKAQRSLLGASEPQRGASVGLDELPDVAPVTQQGCELKGLMADTPENWQELMDTYDVDSAEVDLSVAREMLRQSLLQSRKVIDYDDMLWLPIVAGAPFPQFAVVFVDEVQDLNGIQIEMVSRMVKAADCKPLVGCVNCNGTGSMDSGGTTPWGAGIDVRCSCTYQQPGRVIAVGDPAQCQPAGTLIRTPERGWVPIERLRTGDKVVSVDFAHSCFKRVGDRVTVGKRRFLGKMIEVHSGEKRSRYTPNHRCVVQCKPLVKKSAVYLMQKGNNFRIGSSQFASLRTRLCTEKADRLWLLSLHNTKSKACLEEALVALRFGLSERTFISQTADGSGKGLNQPFLDEFWMNVAPHFYKALNVLKFYGRELEFPWVSKDTAQAFHPRRPSEVRACNVIEGMLVLHAEEAIHYKKHDWKPIELVLRSLFDDFVYSLEVENRQTYIADGIATHNSIYRFRGAHAEAMRELAERFKCKPLPLSISYRCPRAVVKQAQQWVKHIEHAADAAEGLVLSPAEWQIGQFRSSDVVLCRLTRPLVALAFRLIRQRIPCRVLGRDIGQGLLKLIDRAKLNDLQHATRLGEWLDQYEQREIEELKRKQEWGKIGLLRDRVETLRLFLVEAVTVAEVRASVEGLFKDNGSGSGMTLSTIHKFKGQEAPRVFVLDAADYMPPAWATDLEQEKHLCYVAATRAQEELYYITSKGLRNETKGETKC